MTISNGMKTLPLDVLTEIACALPVYSVFRLRWTAKIFTHLNYAKIIPLHTELRHIDVQEILQSYFAYPPLARHFEAILYIEFILVIHKQFGVCNDFILHDDFVASFTVPYVGHKQLHIIDTLRFEEVVKEKKRELDEQTAKLEYKRHLPYFKKFKYRFASHVAILEFQKDELHQAIRKRFTQSA